jgi:hypothetical protein
MCRFLVATVVAVLLVLVSTSTKAVTDEQKDNSPKQTDAIPPYPESEDGLKNLIGDIFSAMKSGETDLPSSYFVSLEIPDRVAWFTKEFGPVEGSRLEVKYQALLQQPSAAIRAHFEYALKGGSIDVEVHVLRGTADAKSVMSRAILDAMVQPFPLYSADGTNPTEQYAA